MTDVVLLERDKLTSGTTWHAAGEIVPAVHLPWAEPVAAASNNSFALASFARSHQLGQRNRDYVDTGVRGDGVENEHRVTLQPTYWVCPR